jgi:ribosome-associated translation inhibitor RaiA
LPGAGKRFSKRQRGRADHRSGRPGTLSSASTRPDESAALTEVKSAAGPGAYRGLEGVRRVHGKPNEVSPRPRWETEDSMQIPLKITMRNIPQSDALETRIREKAAKLEEFHPNVTGCDIAVEEQRRHHHQGRWFNVRVVVRVPGHEIVVNRDHDEDPYVAARDAFDAAVRRLEEVARVQRGDVKVHPQPLHGTVARIFADEGYGFVATNDGGEFYFSRENVVDPPFEHLAEGMEVQFVAEPAAEGMQAKRVSAGKHALPR